MLSRLLVIVLTLTIVAVVTLADPPAAEAQRKKVLNIAAKEPDTLDPHSSTLGQSQAITRFMFRGLTRFAIKDGKVTTAEVEPDLAESWTLSPDGTRVDVQAQEGRAVPQGLRRDDRRGREVQLRAADQQDAGHALRREPRRDQVASRSSIRTPCRSRSRPTTRSSCCAWSATSRATSSRRRRPPTTSKFKWNPVGTGPFYFERHSPREKIVLKAFDKFVGGRPQIDEVHWFDVPEDATKLIGLEKGTFDMLYPEAVTADFADQVKKMGAIIDRRGPGGQERFYINMTAKPFDDIRVRRAFMHAIDRKAIKETMYPGGLAKLATSCVPPGYFGHVPMTFPEHDPEKAKKLLAEAGHPERLHDQELLHQQVVLLSQGDDAGPGAAQEGRASTSSCRWSSTRPSTRTSART